MFKHLLCWLKGKWVATAYLVLAYTTVFNDVQVPLNYSLHNTLGREIFILSLGNQSTKDSPFCGFHLGVGPIALAKGSRAAHVVTAFAQPHLAPASQCHTAHHLMQLLAPQLSPYTSILPLSKAFLAHGLCHAQYLSAVWSTWQFPYWTLV